MISECQVGGCPLIARIIVSDPIGAELMVCRTHWRDALEASGGQICGVRLIEGPDCFHDACRAMTVVLVWQASGTAVPACQQHADDLSWVNLGEPLLSDEPGWSGG